MKTILFVLLFASVASAQTFVSGVADTKLVPSQTGNSGKVLTTDGTNTSWVQGGGGSIICVTGLNGGGYYGIGDAYSIGTTNTDPTTGYPGSNDCLYSMIIPANGTVSTLYVALDANAGAGSYTVTFWKNGSATSLAVSITGATATGNDATHIVSVSAGDIVTFYSDYSGYLSAHCIYTPNVAVGNAMSNPLTTTGDIIYSSSGSTASRLGIGSSGDVLTVSGGVPSWAAPTAAAGTLTGTTLNATVVTSSLTSVGTIATGLWNGTKISEAYGGTNQSTYTAGDILYASASNTLSKLGIGSTGDVLTVSGGVPSWSAPTGGWTRVAVTGSDFTTTNTTATDITGLSFSAAASTTYEIEATLYTASSTTAGIQFAVASTGGSPTVNAVFTGQTNATAVGSIGVSASGTLEGTAFNAVAANGVVKVWGVVQSGTGTPTIKLQVAKKTSGTATVYIGSTLRYRVLGN